MTNGTVSQVQEINDRLNKPLNSLFHMFSNFSPVSSATKTQPNINLLRSPQGCLSVSRIIYFSFLIFVYQKSKNNRKERHMEINISIRFCSEIGAILFVLLLDNKIISASNRLADNISCTSTGKDSCVILCTDWKSESKNNGWELKDILKAEKKRFQNCTIILEEITRVSPIWNEINPNDDNPEIVELKIRHSPLDLNRLDLTILKNLTMLTIENTTTTGLRSEVFNQLPKLQKLQVKQPNLIKWVENGILREMPLESLQINGIHLDQTGTAQLFKNLTGGQEIPAIYELDWSHNNFGTFTKDLLAPFRNVEILILTNSSISAFDEETFTTVNPKNVVFNENKIQKLPESVFRILMENASFVSLEGNDLICDCEMKWLQSLVKRRKQSQTFRIGCAQPAGAQFLNAEMCPKDKLPTVYCTLRENSEFADDYRFLPIINDTPNKFTITNNRPGLIEITISNTIPTDGVFLWYGNYANATSPRFKCLKILQKTFTIYVNPEVNYLICMAMSYSKHFHCLPFKTKPPHEKQPWLTNKSKPVLIVCIFVLLLLAAAVGALALYLLVRKNPSLIRGSKRVIEVKRHDKAQVLIMPRGYENSQGDPSSLALLNPLQPTLSCDTMSTVSYVSAHQPTQLEILSYRLNRLRELFQRNNNIPPPIPQMPMQIAVPVNQRLPPNVDLLFEYEWYTITTTTTTTTTTES